LTTKIGSTRHTAVGHVFCHRIAPRPTGRLSRNSNVWFSRSRANRPVGAAEEQHHRGPVGVGDLLVLVGDALQDALGEVDAEVLEQRRALQVLVDVGPQQQHRHAQRLEDDEVGERHPAHFAPRLAGDHDAPPRALAANRAS
jgi:hypothetical protein